MCYKWGNPWGLQEESQISPSPLLSQWRFMPHHLKLSQVAAVHCCSWAHSGWWWLLLLCLDLEWLSESSSSNHGPTVAVGIHCCSMWANSGCWYPLWWLGLQESWGEGFLPQFLAGSSAAPGLCFGWWAQCRSQWHSYHYWAHCGSWAVQCAQHGFWALLPLLPECPAWFIGCTITDPKTPWMSEVELTPCVWISLDHRSFLQTWKFTQICRKICFG